MGSSQPDADSRMPRDALPDAAAPHDVAPPSGLRDWLLRILDKAARVHPAFQLLYVVLGLAVVVELTALFIDLRIALFGALIVLLLLMHL